MTCKLMKSLMDIEGVSNLPNDSIEQIKRIICGTHNGVCSERYSGIKETKRNFNHAVLICAEDWEGLYINNKLVKEGHTLNEGHSRLKVFSDFSKQYDFQLDDLSERYISEEDEKILNDIGNLPENLNDFKSEYVGKFYENI